MNTDIEQYRKTIRYDLMQVVPTERLNELVEKELVKELSKQVMNETQTLVYTGMDLHSQTVLIQMVKVQRLTALLSKVLEEKIVQAQELNRNEED